MTMFDQRDKAFENKFAYDEEITFRAIARRNKLLGLWAAAKLGKNGVESEQYAKDVALADFEGGSMVDKLLKDFTTAKVSLTAKEIHAEMERLLPIARKEVVGE